MDPKTIKTKNYLDDLIKELEDDFIVTKNDFEILETKAETKVFVNWRIKMEKTFWIDSDIDIYLQSDKLEWELLSYDEKKLIMMPLCFFLLSDVIVNKNIDLNFGNEVGIFDISAVYDQQKVTENTHTYVYMKLLDNLLPDENYKIKIRNAIRNTKTIQKKADWALKWMDIKKYNFLERLVAFTAVEGIFFTSSFAVLSWLKEKNILLGLTLSNEWISRDENSHVEFGILVFKEFREKYKIKNETILEIILEAVELEIEFIKFFMSDKSINGLSYDGLCNNVHLKADLLLEKLGTKPYFKVKNELSCVMTDELERKINFFERKGTDYIRLDIDSFTTDSDF